MKKVVQNHHTHAVSTKSCICNKTPLADWLCGDGERICTNSQIDRVTKMKTSWIRRFRSDCCLLAAQVQCTTSFRCWNDVHLNVRYYWRITAPTVHRTESQRNNEQFQFAFSRESFQFFAEPAVSVFCHRASLSPSNNSQ